MLETDSRDPDPTPTPMTVVVKTARRPAETGPLVRLVQLFGLDVYSTSLLGRRTRRDLMSFAVLLGVTFLFDFTLWTMLFNAVFSRGLMTASWRTVPAALLGLAIAAAVIVYERQFVTADVVDGSRWRRGSAIGVRLIVVALSAYATAQPLELLAFGTAIHARAHEEGVRREAAARHAALADVPVRLQELEHERAYLAERRKQVTHVFQSQAGAITSGGQASGQATNALLERLRDKADTVSDELKDLGKQRAELIVQGMSAEAPGMVAVQAQIKVAEAQRTSLEKQMLAVVGSGANVGTEVKARLEGAKGGFVQQMGELRQQEQRFDQEALALTLQEQRLTRWIHKLRESLPDEDTMVWEDAQPAASSPAAVPATGGTADTADTAATGVPTNAGAQPGPAGQATPRPGRWKYSVPQYDIFERLQVISDLTNGEPPRWPASDPVRAKFAFDDPPPGSVEALAKAASLRHMYWAVMVIAWVVPVMALLFKLICSTEMKLYFSGRHQAALGDPDALMVAAARRGAGRV